MQDKFAIGPVTIVQLVGLNTKPRIASAQPDAAVRAADPLPPTTLAAAGIGSDLASKVGEVVPDHFSIKAPPMLTLTAPDMRAHIAFEGAVDRPAGGESGPSPQFKLFDGLPSNIDLAALIATLRNGGTAGTSPTVPSPVPVPSPDAPSTTTPAPDKIAPVVDPVAPTAPDAPPAAIGDTPATADLLPLPDPGIAADGGVIFDGAMSFGDDMILDFEAYYAETGLASAPASAEAMGAAEAELLMDMQDIAPVDLGGYYIVDVAGLLSPEPHNLSPHNFTAPQHQLSAHDGIIAI